MAKVMSYAQTKAQAEQWKLAQGQMKPIVKIAILAPSQPQMNSLPPSVNVSKQLGGQVGYPVHSQKGRPLSETSPKQGYPDGQEGKKPQGEESKRRSDQCLKEAKKNREAGMGWLAEMNEALAMINRHQEDTNTEQLQERANKALNKHLDQINREIP
jgi:hypothetical protein